MDLEEQSSLDNKAQNIYLVLSRNNKYLFLHLLSKHRPLNPDFLTFFARKLWEFFVLLASVLTICGRVSPSKLVFDKES
jgi:hypothetical protein